MCSRPVRVGREDDLAVAQTLKRILDVEVRIRL